MRFRGIGTAFTVASIATILIARSAAGAATTPTPSAAHTLDATAAGQVVATTISSFDDVLTAPAAPAAVQAPVASSETSAASQATEEPAAAAVEPTAPPPTSAPKRAVPAPVAPAPAAAPAAPAPAPTPATCPATWFCYPRLGISGPIVPYTDCSGSTDVGTAIRSYTCLSDYYLMGHAYTQMGLVRQWVAGDVVFAWGHRFTVYGALTEQSCAAPVFPLAPLSIQTSLSSAACGPVLVVQAR